MSAARLPASFRLFLSLLGWAWLMACEPKPKAPQPDDGVPYNIGGFPSRWKLSSVPLGFEGMGYQPADSSTWLRHNDRRALTTWYVVDPLFYRSPGGYRPASLGVFDMQMHYVRAVGPQEVFPERDLNAVNLYETVFDLAYYPAERGPYNFSTDLNPEGKLQNPRQNWGGMTRRFLSSPEIEPGRMRYVEFWMMDPFLTGPLGSIGGRVYDPAGKGREGTLTLDLGDVSEDVLADGKMAFEHGLPTGGGSANPDRTPFGYVPRGNGSLLPMFSDAPFARYYQDVGLDGLRNEQEQTFFKPYLDQVRLRVRPDVWARIEADPAGDDFRFYLDDAYEPKGASVLERYMRYNQPQGNSPLSGSGGFTPAFTNEPDMEDLNRDQQLTQQEGYYSYRIDLRPEQMVPGQNYILEKRGTAGVAWYHFRIPIQDLTHPNFGGTTGRVTGFGNLRFIRFRVNGMAEPVVLRFVRMQGLADR